MAVDRVEIVVGGRISELDVEVVLPFGRSVYHFTIGIERMRQRCGQSEGVGTIRQNDQLEDVEGAAVSVIRGTLERTATRGVVDPLNVDIMLSADAIAVDKDRIELIEWNRIAIVIRDENLRRVEKERIGRGIHTIEMRRAVGAIANIELAMKTRSEPIVARSTLDAVGLVFVVERL